MREVREYAEEKLRMRGVNVVSLGEVFPFAVLGTYRLAVSVGGFRHLKDGSGWCVGGIDIELYTYALVNEHLHQAIISDVGGIGFNPENFNRLVIEVLGDFIGELK